MTLLGAVVPFSVPLLASFREDMLSKVADVTEEVKQIAGFHCHATRK